MNNKKYFITGGGTGGHIYPAVAVADALAVENKIFYVGNPNNLEAKIIKNKPYTFLPIISSGMPRKLSFGLIKWGVEMFLAWLKCCYYIIKFKPDAVFGTGGYVSAPALFAAITMKVPFVMHDCDANPGLVTRKLAPFAKSVSVAFDVEKEKINNKNCYVNGNPIRKDFSTLTKSQARKNLGIEDKLTICIMGGSQGAKKINDSCIKLLQKLSSKNIQVIFQTGQRNYDDVVSNLEEIYPDYKNDKNIIIEPYFDNMTEVLKASDIAISRAGSLSISEICASSIAAIFIPYPYAAADHQRKNAKYMENNNAGVYLDDNNTNSKILENILFDLINNPEKSAKISNNAYKMAKFDAVDKIIQQIEC